MGMKPGVKLVGGLGAALALWLFVRRNPRKGSAVLRIAFAIAVGLGAWWQEKLRQQELANALTESGYLESEDP
jgi:thiol:disulfide interchange protein